MKRGAPAGAPGAAPSGRRSGARAVAACQAGPVLPAARAPRGAPPDAPLVTAAAALGCLAGPPRAPPSPGGGNRGRGAPYASPRLNFPRAAAHTLPGRGRQCVPPKVARPRARFPFKGRVRPACAGRGGGGGGQGQVLTRARECPKARGRPSPASSGVGAELATSESSPNFWAPPSCPGFRRTEAPRWHTRAGSPAPGSGTRQTQGTGSRSAGPRG